MTTTLRPLRLLLTGGGTGGHLFPAVAAAEAMCERLPGTEIMFIGTKRKMDQTSLAGYGYAVKSIHCYGLKGKNIVDLIKALAVLPISFIEAMVQIISFRPDVVLGVGGYVTGPVLGAAVLLGKKTVIHEQNSIPGLANRKLGRLVAKICISLPQSGKYFPSQKTVFTGNPVRKALLELAGRQEQKEKKEAVGLLVLGGSQGAHSINELVTEALTQHTFRFPIKVIHQTGTADCDKVRSQYQAGGVDAVVQPFFTDMVAIYTKADLLVSRAGATTLAELAVLGKPAILIPYPHAADNHQDKNADYYVAGGGCYKFDEHEISARKLALVLEELVSNQEKMTTMSANMKKLAHPDAARKIVETCIEGLR